MIRSLSDLCSLSKENAWLARLRRTLNWAELPLTETALEPMRQAVDQVVFEGLSKWRRICSLQ